MFFLWAFPWVLRLYVPWGSYFCVADHDIQGEFDLFVPRLLCTYCDVKQNVLTFCFIEFCLRLGCYVFAMMSNRMSWQFVSEGGLECESLFLSMSFLWGWVFTTYFCCVCLWYVLVLYQDLMFVLVIIAAVLSFLQLWCHTQCCNIRLLLKC